MIVSEFCHVLPSPLLPPFSPLDCRNVGKKKKIKSSKTAFLCHGSLTAVVREPLLLLSPQNSLDLDNGERTHENRPFETSSFMVIFDIFSLM